MGIYRYWLAILIALAHCGGLVVGLHPGVLAVVSFFVISGYVMSALVQAHYDRPERYGLFCVDRILRIAPQYLFYVVLICLLMQAGLIEHFYVSDVTLATFIANVLIIPISFYAIDQLDLYRSVFIPPVWSLGLELLFYICCPIVILMKSRARYGVLYLLSLAIFMASILQLLDVNFFGFKSLPGTLFVFMTGISLHRNGPLDRLLAATTVLACLGMFLLITVIRPLPAYSFERELLVGIAVGTVMVALLRARKFSRLDAFFGNLSYGVFLNNVMLVWLAQTTFGVAFFGRLEILAILWASTLLAALSYVAVERPAILWRRKIRYRHQDVQAIPEPARALS